MKKLLLILALGTFAACNDGASTTDATDSTANVIDSAAGAKIDSVQNSADSLINQIDSTAEAKIDTLTKK
jgi:hypothetical protein